MNISLTSELDAIVKQKVNSGLYNNASEVVREALRIMLRYERTEEAKLAQLRAAVAVGAEQAERGEFIEQSVSEIIAEAEQEKYGNL